MSSFKPQLLLEPELHVLEQELVQAKLKSELKLELKRELKPLELKLEIS